MDSVVGDQLPLEVIADGREQQSALAELVERLGHVAADAAQRRMHLPGVRRSI